MWKIRGRNYYDNEMEQNKRLFGIYKNKYIRCTCEVLTFWKMCMLENFIFTNISLWVPNRMKCGSIYFSCVKLWIIIRFISSPSCNLSFTSKNSNIYYYNFRLGDDLPFTSSVAYVRIELDGVAGESVLYDDFIHLRPPFNLDLLGL